MTGWAGIPERCLGGALSVSALGLGCMPMVGSAYINYGAADTDEAIATIHRAIELGVRLFDTAEAYGPFVNEELVGKAVRGRRDGLIVATKFGFRFDGDRAVPDSSPATIRRACEGSLRRLGVDAIDLYYQHRIDPAVPIEETVGTVARLIGEGKVRHLGLSEVGVATLRRAVAVHPVTALQTEYSLWERGIEDEILPTCRELGIGLVAYSPLGRGFLAGAVRSWEHLAPTDYRRDDPRFSEANLVANLPIVEAVARVASDHRASAAQVALSWLLAQGKDIVPIPGSKRRATMEDSMAAATIVLSDADLATLNDAAPRNGTAGLRYGPRFLAQVE